MDWVDRLAAKVGALSVVRTTTILAVAKAEELNDEASRRTLTLLQEAQGEELDYLRRCLRTEREKERAVYEATHPLFGGTP